MDVDAIRFFVDVDMTALDWILLAFAFAFIAVLVWTADEFDKFEDDNGYNSEQGEKDAD